MKNRPIRTMNSESSSKNIELLIGHWNQARGKGLHDLQGFVMGRASGLKFTCYPQLQDDAVMVIGL